MKKPIFIRKTRRPYKLMRTVCFFRDDSVDIITLLERLNDFSH